MSGPKHSNSTTWSPGHNPGAGRGRTREELRAKRTLSALVREKFPPERLVEVLIALAGGDDPFDHLKRRPKIEGLAVALEEIPWQLRFKAIEMLAEYGYGRPMQMTAVMADIRQEVSVSGSDGAPLGYDPSRLTIEQRDELNAKLIEARNLLRQAMPIDVPADDD